MKLDSIYHISARDRLLFGITVLTVLNSFVEPTKGADEVSEAVYQQDERMPIQFKALDFYFTGGKYERQKFSYRLYVPSTLDRQKKYPLLLWFHGVGESGTDNEKSLAHVRLAVNEYARKNGLLAAFILVPQVPRADLGWGTHQAAEDDMFAVTWAMLQHTIQENPIDEDRIVASGVSSGGTACWEMALWHPDRFAAIAPISSDGADESSVTQLTDMQIWAFHNTYDLTLSIEGDRRAISAVQAAGGHAHLTDISSGGHDAWSDAFEKYDLLDWLIARRRGEPSLWFDLQFMNWPRIAIQLGLPLLILVASLLEWRRRKLLKGAHVPSFREAKLPDFAELMGG